MSTNLDSSISQVLAELPDVLANNSCVVLQAPPGAGKTTRVPIALLRAPWLGGRKIVMLEPRRLAAKAAAWYMAHLLGEPVGQTVGFRTRYERAVSPKTRIEVVTEGILARRLQNDPALDGVGVVIFDEFHERSLDADLALALCRDVQSGLRDDLRLLIMSATLDTELLARSLDGPPLLRCEGRQFPVSVRYLPGRASDDLTNAVVAGVSRALVEVSGSVLVFLPGEAEIRRIAAALEARVNQPGITIHALFGDLPPAEQERALEPPPVGCRKIVLATSIAETSLTIEGIEAVVDSGLMRVPRFDPRTAMTRLDTVRVTRAAAEQRAGRAGRLGPGVCYRLWSEGEQAGLLAQRPPEIREADLTSLVLDLAQWGVADPGQLRWIDPPPAAAFEQARALLRQLSALDAQGRITSTGRAMADLPVHPRLGYMLLKARAAGHGSLGCWIAAVISERDPLRSSGKERSSDLRLRVEALVGPSGGLVAPNVRARFKRVAAQLAQRLNVSLDDPVDPSRTGWLLAYAYPDRIAQQRDAAGRYLLSNGRGAVISLDDPLSKELFLAVCHLGGAGAEDRVFLAAPISRDDIQDALGALIEAADEVQWDDNRQAVVGRHLVRLGALVLEERAMRQVPVSSKTQALLAELEKRGLAGLPWAEESRQWLARARLVGNLCSDPAAAARWGGAATDWPDFSDAALLKDFQQWLGPFVQGMGSIAQVNALNLRDILQTRLTWEQNKLLEQLAPERIEVPSGSRLRIDYCAGEIPVLAARLQELFGAKETPCIGDGAVPLLLHLLSPAGRPVQITRDLGGFWRGSYQEVRKDMKGRYPKHNWPEDPAAATAHRGVRPR